MGRGLGMVKMGPLVDIGRSCGPGSRSPTASLLVPCLWEDHKFFPVTMGLISIYLYASPWPSWGHHLIIGDNASTNIQGSHFHHTATLWVNCYLFDFID